MPTETQILEEAASSLMPLRKTELSSVSDRPYTIFRVWNRSVGHACSSIGTAMHMRMKRVHTRHARSVTEK